MCMLSPQPAASPWRRTKTKPERLSEDVATLNRRGHELRTFQSKSGNIYPADKLPKPPHLQHTNSTASLARRQGAPLPRNDALWEVERQGRTHACGAVGERATAKPIPLSTSPVTEPMPCPSTSPGGIRDTGRTRTRRRAGPPWSSASGLSRRSVSRGSPRQQPHRSLPTSASSLRSPWRRRLQRYSASAAVAPINIIHSPQVEQNNCVALKQQHRWTYPPMHENNKQTLCARHCNGRHAHVCVHDRPNTKSEGAAICSLM